jgi:hypothetical protein
MIPDGGCMNQEFFNIQNEFLYLEKPIPFKHDPAKSNQAIRKEFTRELVIASPFRL